MRNKFLAVITIFILITFAFINNNAFAVEVSTDSYPLLELPDYVTVNDNGTYSINGIETICTDYMILYSSTYDRYNMVFFNENSFYLDGDLFCFTDVGTYNYFNLEYNKDGSFFRITNGGSIQSQFTGWWEYLFTATCDVYNADGTVFFQVAPVTILVPILEKVEMREPMMKEILTLLPMLIILIVSFLALRKGLAFLKTLERM